jgi:hypothetical protein
VITAMIPTEVDFTVEGNNVVGIGVSSPRAGWIVFVDDAAAEIAAATYRITTPGTGKVWGDGSGITNPLTNTNTSVVMFSHDDATSAQTMKAVAVYD